MSVPLGARHLQVLDRRRKLHGLSRRHEHAVDGEYAGNRLQTLRSREVQTAYCRGAVPELGGLCSQVPHLRLLFMKRGGEKGGEGKRGEERGRERKREEENAREKE